MFVDEFLDLLVQVFLASGQGLAPVVPQDGQVLLLVAVHALLEPRPHRDTPDGQGGDGLADQGQRARVGHGFDSD